MAWLAKQKGGASANNGLMHLDQKNPILLESLSPRLSTTNPLLSPMDLKISDFDSTSYKLTVLPTLLTTITLHVKIINYSDMKKYAEEVLADYFGSAAAGNMWSKSNVVEEGYDVNLTIDTLKIPTDKEQKWGKTREDLAVCLSKIRLLLLGAPLSVVAAQFSTKSHDSKQPPIKVTLQKPTSKGTGGSYYICPRTDRLNIIFPIDFEDVTDKSCGRIFISEFVEAQKAVNNAPILTFWRANDTPGELKTVPDITNSVNGDIIGYLTFTLFSDHVLLPAKRSSTINLLSTFLTYLSYHIKASKTYLHMRMRSKTEELMRVLNRGVKESLEGGEKASSFARRG